jgi:hypothetical protein
VALFDFLLKFPSDHERNAHFASLRAASFVLVAVVRRLGEVPAIRPLLDRPHVEGIDVLRVREHPALLPFDCKELYERGHVLLRAIDTPLRCVEVRGGALCELYSGRETTF